ncbi:type II secretion system F family protein [Campylobacter hyointestinalis]|uniref:Type II secretion system protein F n=1 Tax=Campylobacter hyointestinalis subsp. hyointestinalis TaxID=91352 RepID=A0A855N7D5_CAMHY|nr:type II secretion system F family protein [Campylobacter hyointestinalis]ANE32549.1 transformation system, type II secretion system membrane protein CtsF [Campylobacter hyointestinalis subsp. hyointestinalis LMG 9260]KEA45106.1 type II secretion system protein F [Campylobacter hyointestinalis subsp. hyointestinalis]MBT0611498.1 type II secretion system F family protein [Campylobacter hyointestinalis subsp. hyointestinalis]MDY2999038.1 type II secretion system F family protein [Campylobacter 
MKIYEIEQMINFKRTKVIIKADSLNQARNLAKEQNNGLILKAHEISSIPLDVQIEQIKEQLTKFFLNSKIKIPNLVALVRQISVMSNAGISIHDCIKEAVSSTSDKKLRGIFENVSIDLNAGMSLTESLKKYEYELGHIFIAMIRLGEEGGNLSEALKKLADILQEVWDNQKKFKKAIRYPITVIVAIIIAFVLLMVVVVPKFREIFEQLNATLPLPTIILLNIEYVLSNFGLYILGGIIVSIFLIKKFYKSNSDFKFLSDKYLLKVYLIGDIIYLATMHRFNLVFSELVKAGIPVANALDDACLTIQNSYIKDKMSNVKISVQQGNSLNSAFRDTKLYESMLIQMISAGEKSGSLDSMLEKVTDYYKDKFDNIIDNISSYVEPILLVFIACAVILLGLGIFMPMWDMTNAVK